MSAKDQLGGVPAGDSRGGHHYVGGGYVLSQELALLHLLLVGELASVAALGLRVQLQLDELGPQRTHLLAGGPAHVVRLHDGAQALGRGDGLETRDAGAQYQDFGRPDGPGGVGQHGQEAAQQVCAYQHGLVPGRRGLGGEHVHGLRPGDARQKLHGKAGDVTIAHGEGVLGVPVRVHVAEHHRPRLELRDLVQVGGLDFDENLGGSKDFGRGVHEGDAAGGVVLVQAEGPPAGTALHDQLDAQFEVLRYDARHEGDPGFAGGALCEDAYAGRHGFPGSVSCGFARRTMRRMEALRRSVHVVPLPVSR